MVDNRPGGALTIGMEMTARATPDGYTIGTPEQFAELIRKENAKWAEVVKRSGAKID